MTDINYPCALDTYPGGINNHSVATGYFLDSSSNIHGFIYQNKKFRQFDVPGAGLTIAFGINDSGQLCGYYVNSKGQTVGFIATPK